MRQVYLTRHDTDVGVGVFDSIAWAFETHLHTQDTGEYHFALMTCWNEDSPTKIEFWRGEPQYNTNPDYVWKSEESHAKNS
jgi:hypothetical protein